MHRRLSSFASYVLLLVVLGLEAPTTTAWGGAATYDKRYNKTPCPAEPLPDYNTPTGLLYINSSLTSYGPKSKKVAAVFSFTLAHTDVELYRCDEDGVSDACCATNEAQFVSVALQLDPKRCATRKALKGLKVRIDGQIIPNSHVSVKSKAGTVTIKHVPRLFPKNGDFGYEHSLDLIFPQETECTNYAFQGRTDAWPCAEGGCSYFAVTTVDAPSDKSKPKNYQGRFQYPKMNENDCCVSYGTSLSIGGVLNTIPPDVGVGPPAGTNWCFAGANVARDKWDVRTLSVGDWGASPKSSRRTATQRKVAAGMAAVAHDCDFELVINVGDNFYENGLLGGKSIPPGATDFKARFKQTWTDIYQGNYTSLENLVWYGTYGNHDIGIYDWEAMSDEIKSACFAPTGETWTDDYCLTQANCCASPLWQTTSVVNDPMWVLEPGEYSVNVSNPNAAPTADPLIEFFFLDSNPYIDKYFQSDGPYNAYVPGGLNEWRVVRDQTKASFLSRIENSKATWKIPVIHTSLASYGSHCGFNSKNPKNPDDPTTNTLDQKDCQYFVDLRRELLNMGIRLTMHGHDHSQQFVRFPAGYDGTSGGKEMYALTTGAGCKQDFVLPGPVDMQIWPRNACGGGTPCENDPDCTNKCATYDDKNWEPNRQDAEVGFSSLRATPDELLVRVFEVVRISDTPGLAPTPRVVEWVQQLITK